MPVFGKSGIRALQQQAMLDGSPNYSSEVLTQHVRGLWHHVGLLEHEVGFAGAPAGGDHPPGRRCLDHAEEGRHHHHQGQQHHDRRVGQDQHQGERRSGDERLEDQPELRAIRHRRARPPLPARRARAHWFGPDREPKKGPFYRLSAQGLFCTTKAHADRCAKCALFGEEQTPVYEYTP